MSRLIKEGVSGTAGLAAGTSVSLAGATGAATSGVAGAAAMTSSLATIGGVVGGGMIVGLVIVGVSASVVSFFTYKGVKGLGKRFGWWE